MSHSPVPAVIITRDRVTYADRCLNALRSSRGIGDIHIVDHGSTYPDMETWLGTQAGQVDLTRYSPDGELALQKDFRQHVHWLPNQHPRDLWAPGNVLAKIIRAGQRFIVTDHDIVVPHEVDWVATLHAMLDQRPDVVKAGLALRLHDLPPWLPTTARVLEWESQWRPPQAPWKVPSAEDPIGWVETSVDTTVAMYRRLEPYALAPALRTVGYQLEAQHLPWYEDLDGQTEEQQWYALHAEHGHWRDPDGFADWHAIAPTE